jgi:histone H1/5
MRRAGSTDIKSRGFGSVQRSSNFPRPRYRHPKQQANITQAMSSPIPSPLASPAPEAAIGKKSPARAKSSRVAKSGATKKATPAKKSATVKKPTMKKSTPKAVSADHPSWKDIIKVHLRFVPFAPLWLLTLPQEAITQHREDARTGVSRSAIKKACVLLIVAHVHLAHVWFQYAEEKYKLDMTSASNLHQLNLALTRGAEKETFVFPKGPSGKVKLAPKRLRTSADTKEVRYSCILLWRLGFNE